MDSKIKRLYIMALSVNKRPHIKFYDNNICIKRGDPLHYNNNNICVKKIYSFKNNKEHIVSKFNMICINVYRYKELSLRNIIFLSPEYLWGKVKR